jgi:two-component system sensor histidine kinase MprB
MSLRLRVALLTAAAVALVEIAVLVLTYVFVSRLSYAQVEDELRATANVLVPIVTATGDLPRPGLDPGNVPNIRRVITSDGRVVSTRSAIDLPVTPMALHVAAGEPLSAAEVVRSGNDPYSILTVSAGGGRALQVGRSVAPLEDLLRQLLIAAVALGAIGLFAALIAGAAVASGARLERVVAELKNARRAQRQLVADASHELRAPLATLRANVELLSLGPDAPIADRQALSDDTRRGIEDLTALVGQLIDLAREDQRVHARVPVRLDEVIADEVDRIQRRYPAVLFASDLEPTNVTGDAEALTRAVANLLDNAGKWTPEGGRVQVDLHRGRLEVRDQGPGIAAEDLPHIFERFYRGSGARGIPGSGLGLAIVAQVLASHGGTVSARSGAEGGAVFTATFARADI